MAPLAASIGESSFLEIGDEFPDLVMRRFLHELSFVFSICVPLLSITSNRPRCRAVRGRDSLRRGRKEVVNVDDEAGADDHPVERHDCPASSEWKVALYTLYC